MNRLKLSSAIIASFATFGVLVGSSMALFSSGAQSTNNVFAAAEIFPSPSPIPINPGDVVINEIYYDVCTPANDCGNNPQNEWVELYNSTNNVIDLTDWTLEDNSSSDTIPSASIQPHSFVVITSESHTFDIWSNVSDDQRVILGSSIGNGLSDTGDRLILKDSNQVIVDVMSYGDDTSQLNPAATDVSKGHSLERDPNGVDTDTAADFIDRSIPQPGL